MSVCLVVWSEKRPCLFVFVPIFQQDFRDYSTTDGQLGSAQDYEQNTWHENTHNHCGALSRSIEPSLHSFDFFASFWGHLGHGLIRWCPPSTVFCGPNPEFYCRSQVETRKSAGDIIFPSPYLFM